MDSPKRIMTRESHPHLFDVFGKPIGKPYRSGELEIVNGLMLSVKKQLVEIQIPSQAVPVNTYSFPDQPNLRNASIWGIEIYNAAQVPKSWLTQGNLLSDAQLGYVALNLQDYASFNFFQYTPARNFQTITRAASTPGREGVEGLVGQHVNWPNCNIVFSDPTQLAANTAISFLMEVRYTYQDNWQRDGLGKDFGTRN